MSLKPVSSSSSSTVNTSCPFKDVSYDSSGTSDLNCITTDGSSQESTLPFRKRRKTATQQSTSSSSSSSSNTNVTTTSNLVSGSTGISSPIGTMASGTSSPQPLLSSSNDLMVENESESNSHENSPANDIINQILENLDNKSIEETGSNGSPKGDDDLAGTEDDLSNLISESDADELLKQLHSTDPDSVVDSVGVGVGVEPSDISSHNSSSTMGLGSGSDDRQSQSQSQKLPPITSLTNEEESTVHQQLHQANVNPLHNTNEETTTNQLNTSATNVSNSNTIYSSTESHTSTNN